MQNEAMKSKAGSVLSGFKMMEGDRTSLQSHFQEIAEYVIPRRANFTVKRQPGARRTANLYDSTAIWANETLAGGLSGMLTSPAAPWFFLKPKNPALNTHRVRVWLEEVQRALYLVFGSPVSGFHTASNELYLDLGAFGTAVMLIEEGAAGMVNFSTLFLGDNYVAENQHGRIDRVFRKFEYTARQIEQRWGANGLPEGVLKALESEPAKLFPIIHAVVPREQRNPMVPTNLHMAYASLYVLMEGEHLLSEGGYEEFPFVVPRWAKISGEVYGRSPGMIALPDIRMVNEMQKTVLTAANLAVRPPLSVPDDGYITPVNISPGKINYYRAGVGGKIEVVHAGGDVRLGEEKVERTQQAILRAFHIDRLQLPGQQLPGGQNPYMSATETDERTREKLMLSGPMITRLQNEFQWPAIERTFSLMDRMGLLPEPPPELEGQDLDVEYIGPMAKAQRAMESTNSTRWLATMAPLADRDPELLDVLDTDEFARYSAEVIGVPERILRSQEEILKRRKARADARAREEGITDGAAIATGFKDATAGIKNLGG